MSTTITGKLNDNAKEFPGNSGISFLVRIGVKEYDFKEKRSLWVNYSAFVFAKEGRQADYYRQVLVTDAVVEVMAKGVIPEAYGDQGNITLKLQDPKIGYVFAPQGTQNSQQSHQQPAQQAPAPQKTPEQQPTQTPQQQQPPAGFEDFDDDIPF